MSQCTRPPEQCKGQPAGPNRLPFAALPHDLAADGRLSPTEKLVAVALLFWARQKDHCWPGDPALAARVGRSVGTVQRCLRALEDAGWIARERRSGNRTGRLIRLLWRVSARPSRASAREALPAPARDEGDVIVEPDATKTGARSGPGQRSRSKTTLSVPAPKASTLVPTPVRPTPARSPMVAPTPFRTASKASAGALPAASRMVALTAAQRARLEELSAATRVEVLAWLGSGDRIMAGEALRLLAPRPPRPERPGTAEELLLRIREDPTWVPAAAEVLASGLNDRKSWSGFHAACRRAWEGSLEPAALVDAWRQATGGKARNPGAVFMTVLKRYQEAPPRIT